MHYYIKEKGTNRRVRIESEGHYVLNTSNADIYLMRSALKDIQIHFEKAQKQFFPRELIICALDED